MNCKDTQAAIDSASRRAPVSQLASTHIAGCADCRRHADETSALLALLAAQPRVQAPADFAFRVRARIARAESRPSGPFAFLETFFGQSFSIKQTAASLATLAVIAAATTFYFTGGIQPGQPGQPVASTTPIAQVEVPAPPVAPMPTAVAEEKSGALRIDAPKPVVRVASNPRASAPRVVPASLQRETSLAAASRENMARIYVRERGQVMEVPTRPVFGAEGSVAMARPTAYTAGF